MLAGSKGKWRRFKGKFKEARNDQRENRPVKSGNELFETWRNVGRFGEKEAKREMAN